MGKFLRMLADGIHLIYPKRCPLCDRVLYVPLGNPSYPLCAECKGSVEYVKEPMCKKCGKPLTNEEKEYCRDCVKHTHSFVQGKALWVYKGSVKESIYRMKYGNRREYGISYAQEIVRKYGKWIRNRGIEAILPIPLHKKRLRLRGYNQAEIIAKEMGRILELPVCAGILQRTIDTKPQKTLNDKERKNNLKKAFKIVKNDVQLRKVLLVDDIYTTGSTVDGAAEALRKAGVSEIYCICVSIGRGY